MIWVGLWCTGQIFFRVLTGFNLNIWETRGIGKLNGMAKHPKLVSDESVLCSVVSGSLWPHGLSARLLCPWGFSRQEYWSGLLCPPPGDLPTPGSNPGLLHCSRILYHLSHQGSPRGTRQSGFRDLALDHWIGGTAPTRVQDSCCPRQVPSSVWWRWLSQIIEGLRVTLKNLDLIR